RQRAAGAAGRGAGGTGVEGGLERFAGSPTRERGRLSLPVKLWAPAVILLLEGDAHGRGSVPDGSAARAAAPGGPDSPRRAVRALPGAAVADAAPAHGWSACGARGSLRRAPGGVPRRRPAGRELPAPAARPVLRLAAR